VVSHQAGTVRDHFGLYLIVLIGVFLPPVEEFSQLVIKTTVTNDRAGVNDHASCTQLTGNVNCPAGDCDSLFPVFFDEGGYEEILLLLFIKRKWCPARIVNTARVVFVEFILIKNLFGYR
jgi:hypothetical protein